MRTHMTTHQAPSSNYFAKSEPAESAVWLLDSEGAITLASSDRILHCIEPPRNKHLVDITVAGNSALWIVARDDSNQITLMKWDGQQLHEYVSAGLTGAVRVFGAQDGGCWLLKSHQLTKIGSDSGSEIDLTFDLHDFHEGPNGALWAVGGMRRLGGFEVRHLGAGEKNWFVLPSPAAAVSISSAPDTTAWSVNAQGDVWRLNPKGGGHFAECQVLTGCTNCLFSKTVKHAREISVSPNGTVWILTRRAANKGYAIEWIADFGRKELRSLSERFGAVRIAATKR